MSAVEEPYSRRQMLAEIALADAPTPKSVRFFEGSDSDRGALDLPTSADVRAWAGLLGVADEQVRTIPATEICPWAQTVVYAWWHGWHFQIAAAEEPTADPELDEATRAQLGAVAEGGDPR